MTRVGLEMLTLPSSIRTYRAAEPVDPRRSIDVFSALVSAEGHDVYSGHLFVFGGRRRDRIKLLAFDRGGSIVYFENWTEGHSPSRGSLRDWARIG